MSKSIVFVVGAGASHEAGLPLGAQLRHEIASALGFRFSMGRWEPSGSSVIYEALHHAIANQTGKIKADINDFARCCLMIRDAMPQSLSIDNYLDCHRDNQTLATCGKLAIANCILEAERKSSMYVNWRNPQEKINFSKLEPTWYNEFFRLLVQNCHLDDLPARLAKVAVITFNYDRCIEHYLHQGLMNYYGIGSEQAAGLISKLKIFHPYGSIGPLPWQSPQNSVSFGGDADGWSLVSIVQRLKTFTEGTDEGHSEIEELRLALQSAMKLVFLGFAFYSQNLELLFGRSPYPVLERTVPVFATAMGISKSDIELIGSDLGRMGGYQMPLTTLRGDLTCYKLFHEFSRSLSIN